jgi:hypothetical protein
MTSQPQQQCPHYRQVSCEEQVTGFYLPGEIVRITDMDALRELSSRLS